MNETNYIFLLLFIFDCQTITFVIPFQTFVELAFFTKAKSPCETDFYCFNKNSSKNDL